MISKAEVLNPEFNTKPRVYYIGLPKRFIAGAVYDPEKDVCINGANVTITDSETGEKFATSTDDFGDFWLGKLKVGTYSMIIEKKEYKKHIIESISTEQDVNLGDIKMFKTS